MPTPRYDFYESDEVLTLSIYIRDADAEQVKVEFTENSLDFAYGESTLKLSPLKGAIDVSASGSDYSVRKVKIEVRLKKSVAGRWGTLVKEATAEEPQLSAFPASSEPAPKPKQRKNWESVATGILNSEKEKTSQEDPNAGGDTALNGFFQQLYSGADEDSRRAMMKSFVESGGTTLSTNWDEVGKGNVEVKPPEGSEWKKWAA